MFHHAVGESDFDIKCGLDTNRFEDIVNEYKGCFTTLEEIVWNSRKKALAITFDDGHEDQYRVAYPYLRERNIPFTVFIALDYLDAPGFMTTIRKSADTAGHIFMLHGGGFELEASLHCDLMKAMADKGYTVTAYNFETEEYDSLEITEDNIKDLDTNIRIAAMLLQNCIRFTYPNIAQAIQTYNFGVGNMCDVLDAYEENENISRDDAIKRINDDKWLEYRNIVPVGDEKYLEHVLSYIPTNTITILDSNGNPLKIKIQNDYINEKTY